MASRLDRTPHRPPRLDIDPQPGRSDKTGPGAPKGDAVASRGVPTVQRLEGSGFASTAGARPTRLQLPSSADALPRWFEGRRSVEDVTLGMDQLPELIRLLARGTPKADGDTKVVPAVVMDLDKTVREGSLTPDVARAVLHGMSSAVDAVKAGAERGRKPPSAATQGAERHWFLTPLKKALTGLAVASGPLPFTGRTEAEVEGLTRALLDQTGGGRIFHGIREAVREMERQDLRPFIVTAGLEAPARVVGERIGVPREHIRGTRPVTTPGGHILPLPQLPLPFAEGKSTAMSDAFQANGIDANANPVLVMGDNPVITDSGLVQRGWVDAIVEPDAQGRAYIEAALARGEKVFAIDVHRLNNGSPVRRFDP